MSLTSILKSKDKRALEFQKIIETVNDTVKLSKMIDTNPYNMTVTPYILTHWQDAGQVGTAFDYIARFILKKYQYSYDKDVTNPEYYYIAQAGLLRIKEYSEEMFKTQTGFYLKALEKIDSYIKSDPSIQLSTLVSISVYFAKLESFYRGGYSAAVVNSLNSLPTMEVGQDVLNLALMFEKLFVKEHFVMDTNKADIHYNPKFGICSTIIGGADADLIINDILVDFKTIKDPMNNPNEHVKQLIGYYLFNKYIEGPTINSICLYYARHNKFLTYTFNDSDEIVIEKALGMLDRFIKRTLDI